MRAAVSIVVLALAGCRGDAPPAPAPTLVTTAPSEVVVAPAPAPIEDAAHTTCAERLRARDGIDVGPEPRICDDLEAALALLPAALRDKVKDLVIVRDARGPCQDRCPDLASALMSDGALAFYRVGRHELHVLDATLEGARWRGAAPTDEAIRVYVDALGLPDWAALVARLRARPCVTLPADVPEGASVVFEQIVRCGAPILLGHDVPRRDLLLHELGHAVLLAEKDESARVRAWGTLSGWRARAEDKRADGYVGGFFASELPIVASRLALGLPRGDDSRYLPTLGGLPTGYAGFDPMEDYAESLRLALTEPVALGRASPAKLLVLGAGAIDLTRPDLRPFLGPGARALLAAGVDPGLAMETLRAHAGAFATEPALLDALHDPRPLPPPAGLHAEVTTLAESDALVLVIEGRVLRPHDDTIRALYADLDHYLRERDEIQKGIDALHGDW